jgi:predicted SAM-dependent methyltransferase
MAQEQGIRRLNWGCGAAGEPGWVNSDLKDGPTIDITCDILEGFPLPDSCFDYIVSIHALPELHYLQLVDVLRELRRVLKPGGTLRLALPDIDKGIDAYRGGDRDYFLVRDDRERRIGSKFVVHMTWYGYSRSLFTKDFAEELLEKAGFATIRHCEFKESPSGHEGITDLDSRERESLFIEAVK